MLNVNAKQSREFEDPINMVEVDDTIVGLIAAQLIGASLDRFWWVMMESLISHQELRISILLNYAQLMDAMMVESLLCKLCLLNS